jgi:NADPH2:quinone reductase
MKQIQFSRFGGPEVLELVERPLPEPGPGQALVEIKAAGINFAEPLMRQDRYAVTPELPAVPGVEAAGVIAALGPDAPEGLAPGLRVAAPLFAAGAAGGGYADHVLMDAGALAPLPDDLSFEDATALMVQGLTALHLTRQAPPSGKTVLVNAAAGGVGSLLVQLARRSGAKMVVAAAGSAAKLDFALELGADAAIDYTKPDWVDQVRAATGGGPDLIFESAGGEVTRGSLEVLAPGGEIVIYGALNIQGFQFGVPELTRLIFQNQSLTGFALPTLLNGPEVKAGLAELYDLAVAGELRVTIGGAYPLDQAAGAHRALESRATVGKLVLIP